MEKDSIDNTGQEDAIRELDQAKVHINDISDEDVEEGDIYPEELNTKKLSAEEQKKLKKKARKKAKKEKDQIAKKEEEERLKNENEGKDAYEIELAWCIRQLKLGLTNKGVTADQGNFSSISGREH